MSNRYDLGKAVVLEAKNLQVGKVFYLEGKPFMVTHIIGEAVTIRPIIGTERFKLFLRSRWWLLVGVCLLVLWGWTKLG